MERCSEVILYPLTVPPPAPHQPLQLYKVTACLMSSLLRTFPLSDLGSLLLWDDGRPAIHAEGLWWVQGGLQFCIMDQFTETIPTPTCSPRPSLPQPAPQDHPPPQPAPQDHPYPSLLPKTIPTPACSPRPSPPQPAPQDHPYPNLLPETIPTPACSPRPSLPQPAPVLHHPDLHAYTSCTVISP